MWILIKIKSAASEKNNAQQKAGLSSWKTDWLKGVPLTDYTVWSFASSLTSAILRSAYSAISSGVSFPRFSILSAVSFFCFIFQLSCACLNQRSAHYLTCSFLYVFIFFRELLQHITGKISCLQSFRTVLNAPSYMFPIFRTPSVFCSYHIIFSCRMQAAVLLNACPHTLISPGNPLK